MKGFTRFCCFALVSGLLAMSATGCSNDVENRGYISKFSDFSKVKPGVSTKQDVVRDLGSPTTTSMFGTETWYYIGKEETKETFFEPELKSYTAYEITFNGNVVKNITLKDQTAMNDVEVSEDFTRTSGNEVTFMQQLLGNLGKFSPTGRQNRGPSSIQQPGSN